MEKIKWLNLVPRVSLLISRVGWGGNMKGNMALHEAMQNRTRKFSFKYHWEMITQLPGHKQFQYISGQRVHSFGTIEIRMCDLRFDQRN